jgi:hypothetical protein
MFQRIKLEKNRLVFILPSLFTLLILFGVSFHRKKTREILPLNLSKKIYMFRVRWPVVLVRF